MNEKIKDSLLGLMVFVLIFNNIPRYIHFNFIGGFLGSKLVYFPIIMGLIYTVYIEYTHNNLVVYQKKICGFISCYLLITMFSLISGLVNYQYFDIILQGPRDQIEKLPRVLSFLNNHGVEISYKGLLTLWMFARPIKGILLDTLYSFGGAYIIYCWYRNEWQRAVKIACYAVCCSVLVVFAYSSIEILYLAGNEWAANVLSVINPYIHEVKSNGTWWPPLLWKRQLRSVFAEPSYFGIWTAFAMPFLWLSAIHEKKKFVYFFIFGLSFLLFLTKARTSFLIFLGECFIFTILILLFARSKENVKKLSAVLCCSIVAFICSNMFITAAMNKANVNNEVSIIDAMDNYIDSNAGSLSNPDKRSNRARYSVMEADLKIGLDHPLLGVGYSLRNGYIPDYFSEKAYQNNEIKTWLRFREKLGILKFGFPKLGEYTSRFAETGLLGLLAFLTPAFALFARFYKKLKFLSIEKCMPYICFTVALCGIMASGIGDSINITYCYWVLLGIGYAMCFGKD